MSGHSQGGVRLHAVRSRGFPMEGADVLEKISKCKNRIKGRSLHSIILTSNNKKKSGRLYYIKVSQFENSFHKIGAIQLCLRRTGLAIEYICRAPRKVDIRLPGKGKSNSRGARPVYSFR